METFDFRCTCGERGELDLEPAPVRVPGGPRGGLGGVVWGRQVARQVAAEMRGADGAGEGGEEWLARRRDGQARRCEGGQGAGREADGKAPVRDCQGGGKGTMASTWQARMTHAS